GWFECFQMGDEQFRAAWVVLGEELLAALIDPPPGPRPWAWWRFAAPRWFRAALPARLRDLGHVFLQWLPAPRRRLGGVGTAAYEVVAYVPELPFGIPICWVSAV